MHENLFSSISTHILSAECRIQNAECREGKALTLFNRPIFLLLRTIYARKFIFICFNPYTECRMKGPADGIKIKV